MTDETNVFPALTSKITFPSKEEKTRNYTHANSFISKTCIPQVYGTIKYISFPIATMSTFLFD
jgi:hypothetical protein